MAKVYISTKARQEINDILQSVSEFTGFSASSDKLLNEFKKAFELICTQKVGLNIRQIKVQIFYD